MANGFQGKEGQVMPVMPVEMVNLVTERYIELYERITGTAFKKADAKSVLHRIEKNINRYLQQTD